MTIEARAADTMLKASLLGATPETMQQREDLLWLIVAALRAATDEALQQENARDHRT